MEFFDLSQLMVTDENQQQHLLLILNEINRYILESSAALKAKTLLARNQKTSYRKSAELMSITGINIDTTQSLVEFIINANLYFKSFFKFSTNIGHGCNQKARSIVLWLSCFYNKIIFEHINFEQIFGNEDIDPVPISKFKTLLNGSTVNENDDGDDDEEDIKVPINHQHHHKELNHLNHPIPEEELVPRAILQETSQQSQHLYQQQAISGQPLNASPVPLLNHQSSVALNLQSFSAMSFQNLSGLDPAKLSSSNKHEENLFALEQQQNSINNYQAIKDITFIILLIAVIFYKLRHVFKTLVTRFETSWKFLANFERGLDSSFLHENFLEFLQYELMRHRESNKKQIDNLKQEVIFLDKISKIVDKEIERNQASSLKSYASQSSMSSNNVGRNQQQSHSSSQLNFLAQSSIEKNNHDLIKGSRPCPECGKVFRNSYKLNRHLYVHKDPSEKPFVCDWDFCHYRSISKNDLNRHKMIHTGEKPFACDVNGCEKRYSRADKLRQHKLSVHCRDVNKKEQICIRPGCDFRCQTKNELNRHQLTHEPIKCDQLGCDKIFDKIDKLRKHKEKDHDQKMDISKSNAANVYQQQQFVVPVTVTSTPDVATLACSSANQHHSLLQMQHVMLSANYHLNNLGAINHLNDSASELSDLSATATAEAANNNNVQIINAVSSSSSLSSSSSIPISVVATINNHSTTNQPQQQTGHHSHHHYHHQQQQQQQQQQLHSNHHRQNTISVWSS